MIICSLQLVLKLSLSNRLDVLIDSENILFIFTGFEASEAVSAVWVGIMC